MLPKIYKLKDPKCLADAFVFQSKDACRSLRISIKQQNVSKQEKEQQIKIRINIVCLCHSKIIYGQMLVDRFFNQFSPQARR